MGNEKTLRPFRNFYKYYLTLYVVLRYSLRKEVSRQIEGFWTFPGSLFSDKEKDELPILRSFSPDFVGSPVSSTSDLPTFNERRKYS